MDTNPKITVAIDSKYHRDQFDDWLAGGKIEFNGKIYYWSACDSNRGFGWDIEPVYEREWNDIDDGEYEQIIKLYVVVNGLWKKYQRRAEMDVFNEHLIMDARR